MRGVGWQEVERVFVNGDIHESVWRGRRVARLEKHRSAVLVEEFRSRVDMIIGPGIWATNDHDGQTGCAGGRRVVNAVVVHRWLKEVGVIAKPCA